MTSCEKYLASGLLVCLVCAGVAASFPRGVVTAGELESLWADDDEAAATRFKREPFISVNLDSHLLAEKMQQEAETGKISAVERMFDKMGKRNGGAWRETVERRLGGGRPHRQVTSPVAISTLAGGSRPHRQMTSPIGTLARMLLRLELNEQARIASQTRLLKLLKEVG